MEVEVEEEIDKSKDFETTMEIQAESPEQQDKGAAHALFFEVGTVLLEKFEVLSLLGRGGMGSVYRVRNVSTGDELALKCLNTPRVDDASWRRFQNEARAAQLLDHPNMLKVFELGLLPSGQPYFETEIVEGISLSEELKRSGNLEVERAIKIFIQVAFALGYAHERKIIHRDIKPSNIMLEQSENPIEPESVKVVDFGIAKLTGIEEFNQQTLTKTGEIFGSPLYMSPEQCMGIAVDHKCDLYSLGCVMYETLTGAPPFLGESALSTMMKHQQENPLSLTEASLGRKFPKRLEKIVSKLLEKNPNNRYASASSLAVDLIQLNQSLALTGNQEISSSQAADKKVLDVKHARENVHSTKDTAWIKPVLTGVTCFSLGFLTCYFFVLKQNQYDDKKQNSKPVHQTRELPTAKTLPEKNYFSKSANPAGVRVFDFPNNFSLGTLYLDNGNLFEAIKTVKIPARARIALKVRPFLFDNPELLSGFREDDLTVLDLSNDSTGIIEKEGDLGYDSEKRRSSEHKAQRLFSKLGSLKSLVGLNLAHTDFSDNDLPGLDGLSNLKFINVSGTVVTGNGLSKLKILDNLHSLHCSLLRQPQSLIARIQHLPHLRELTISITEIRDDDLKKICQCKSLRVLALMRDTYLTKVGLKHLFKLKNLRMLSLSGDNFQPDIREELSQLKSLTNLTIADMGWSEAEKLKFEKELKETNRNLAISWIDEPLLKVSEIAPNMEWAIPCLKARYTQSVLPSKEGWIKMQNP